MENYVKPQWGKGTSALKDNFNSIIICLSLCVVFIYFEGIPALYQIITCVSVTAFSEYLFMKLILKRQFSSDLSFLVTGLVIALLLPASAPLYVSVCASVFAVAVCVFPFGGYRNAPFSPAAAGLAFVSSAFSSHLLPDSENLTSLLSGGEVFSLDFFSVTDILTGALPSSSGSASVLVLFAGAVYLFIVNRQKLIPSLGYLLSSAVFAFAFPRVNSGRLTSVFLEVCAGSLIFTSLLLINSSAPSYRKSSHAFLYGFFGGIITMLLRHFSPSLMPEIFSVLIMNALGICFSSQGKPQKEKSFIPSSFSERKEAESR